MSTLTLKEIAKNVRTAVAAKVKAGELPTGLKVSVRTQYYSMGQSLHVSVSAVPEGFAVLNEQRLRYCAENPKASVFDLPEFARDNRSPAARAVLDTLEALATEQQTRRVYDHGDYIVDCNFHVHVSFGWELVNAAEKAFETTLRAEQEQVEAAAAAAAVEPATAPVAPAATKPRVYLRAVIGNRVG